MWFGTIGNMREIPDPAFNADFSPEGYTSGSTFLNGGRSRRNSVASAMIYNMEWTPTKARDKLRPVADYASGKNGPGLIYFIDPMAADKNVLSEHWAFPAQAAYDAPVLLGANRPSTVGAVQTVSSNFDYPRESARYSLLGGAVSRTHYIPIPPGRTVWFGAHGSANGWSGVKIRPHVSGTVYAEAVYPELMSVTDANRVNVSFSSAQYQGIEISLGASPTAPPSTISPSADLYPSSGLYPATGGVAFIAPATSLVLSGMIAQVLLTGATPVTGDFISGQGHSGCAFVGKPQRSAYSAGLDLVGMTAVLEEVGGWR